jgi:hypothetical protein
MREKNGFYEKCYLGGFVWLGFSSALALAFGSLGGALPNVLKEEL